MLEEMSAYFQRGGRNPFHYCVAAVDGIAIRICEPARGKVPNPSTYYNRKGFFSDNVQATVCVMPDTGFFTFSLSLPDLLIILLH